MPVLSCPRCELTMTVARGHDHVEHCPRCLARSGGTISEPLGPRPAKSQLPRTRLIVRLMRGRKGIPVSLNVLTGR